jgi:2-aminoadipate transaminase
MAIRLAERMNVVRASDIRELLKVTQRPEIISFAGGLPAPEHFPTEELIEVTREILRTNGSQALQYSTTEGHPPLRRLIAERMNSLWGTHLSPDDILVTTGSQQGLDLSGKLFLDPGDTVLCESPTYVGAISALNAFQPRWVEVPTDEDGMVIEALEERLDRDERVRMIYVIPNFQNPSGLTWSLERRRRFMEAINRRSIPVVEDNPYGELRFEGVSLPSLQAFDEAGNVVSLGTFSKIMCPGLRVGWLAAAPALRAKYVIVKQGADLHTTTLGQMQIAAYFERVDLAAKLERLRSVYRERRDAMMAALDREMPAGVRWTRPQGGLFVWLELPAGVDAREALRRALERNVAFVPGDAFFPQTPRPNTLRLNYSNMPVERIAEGIRRLATVFTELASEHATAAAEAAAAAFRSA